MPCGPFVEILSTSVHITGFKHMPCGTFWKDLSFGKFQHCYNFTITSCNICCQILLNFHCDISMTEYGQRCNMISFAVSTNKNTKNKNKTKQNRAKKKKNPTQNKKKKTQTKTNKTKNPNKTLMHYISFIF